jgi:hypothetical protein
MKKFGVMLAIVMAISIVSCLTPAPTVIPLPPPIPFLAPPELVVLPDTDVYVVPDYDQDIYFYGGWWWRPWGGRWYRSLSYDSGWAFYHGVPGWYGGVHPRWRDNYHNHMWGGHRWDHRPVPYGDVRANWKDWQSSGYWRNQKNRGTTGSYRQGVENRRDFRGFGQETRGQQAPVPTRQAPAQTKGQQAPVTTRQAPDLSKNKSAFGGGVGRGSDARIQSTRGSQSRQSMSSKGAGGGGRGNVGRDGGSGGGSKGDAGRPR